MSGASHPLRHRNPGVGRQLTLEQERYWSGFKTSELTLAASLAAIYIVSTFFPLTPFIGGASFITFEIIMLPVIAAVLRPLVAAVTTLVGSLGMALAQTSFYPIFGPFGLLIPTIAATAGSFAFHYRWGPLVPWTYVFAGAIYYVLYSVGGTMYWLIPYALVLASIPALQKIEGPYRIGLLVFYTAMTEQVTLNVLSISLLGLVGPIWAIITPFMYSERALATIGGAVIVLALKSRLGTRIELGSQILREVK